MTGEADELERLAALYGPAAQKPAAASPERAPGPTLRMPPHRIDAEQAVLGGLMLVPEAWSLVADTLTVDSFYLVNHGLIWKGIEFLADKGRPFDAVTLGDWFERQGLADRVDGGAYLVELASTTPSAANIRAYAEIVAEQACRRRLITAGTEMVDDGYAQDGRELQELLANASHRLSDLQPAQQGGLKRAAATLGGWFDRFVAQYESGSRMTGLPTPWSGFNDVTHGLQPATLYFLAARPSMGKSVAALDLARFTALRGQTVGLFSLEASTNECHERNIAALAGIPHAWVTAPTPEGDDDYLPRMTAAVRDLKAAPLFIDDTAGITVRQFEARARRMHHQHPLDLLIVDHIHDFTIDAKLARFEYGRIAQVAKNLAKEWGIPVVLLAQLNRNLTGRAEKRPTLADLRESGELEQKGDVIVFLHREDYYDTPETRTHLQGVVEMHFAKGRNLKAGARVYLRNRFDQMRLDDWEGPLPAAPAPEPRRARGFGGRGFNPGADE